ncbi:hypothetical protein AALO_G00197150 [Alosa alosa]|uniref:Uncharacterized protein n=1 Tax=Alosa alosa TaxID=278164 RepID=A0AAV6G4H2_9TELE|nr:hypothetical protein AALO_G00197150 [Alosa alosa]
MAALKEEAIVLCLFSPVEHHKTLPSPHSAMQESSMWTNMCPKPHWNSEYTILQWSCSLHFIYTHGEATGHPLGYKPRKDSGRGRVPTSQILTPRCQMNAMATKHLGQIGPFYQLVCAGFLTRAC